MQRQKLTDLLSEKAPVARSCASAKSSRRIRIKPGDAREIFKLRYKTWALGVGSVMLSDKERVTWLGERLQPSWGMGCSICASFCLRMTTGRPGVVKKVRRSFSTKWARFQVTSAKSVQVCCLRKHSLSEVHIAAVNALRMPDDLLVCKIAAASDTRLLSGAVPQPEDWLHAWSATKRGLSNRDASALNFTTQFIVSSRIDVQAVQRKALSQMQRVMQENIRRKKRAFLGSAVAIALSVDDKSPYRIVRFKACAGDGQTCSGLLCVLYPLKVLMESPPEAWDQDKCFRAADSIAEGIKSFCTLPSGQVDECLRQHILSQCRSFTADGAPYAQKTGRALRERHCPNIILIFRDAAHMLRISSKDPLFCGEAFNDAWQTFFGSDGGIVPDLQYSPEMRAKLATLNNMLLQDGHLGGILKSNLRHLCFAKQRWESTCSPQRDTGSALSILFWTYLCFRLT